jgi:two-component system, OmpR family, phosphate regulon sensor histidine kinase PhoR
MEIPGRAGVNGPEGLGHLLFGYSELEAFYHHAPCGFQTLDRKGRLLSVNQTLADWLGYPREQMLGGMGISDVVPLEALRGFWDSFETVLGRGGSQELEVPFVRRDGSKFPALITSGILPGAGGESLRVFSVVLDLTRRKRDEEAESARSREAVQREFVANISHEFRTPLAAILGFAETLREGAIEDPRFKQRFIATIERHARRLAGLIDNVLDLSAREAGRQKARPEALALGRQTRLVVRELSPLAKNEALKLSIKIPGRLAVLADKAQLEQVLHNLIGNAIKYNRRGGRVAIEARAKGQLAEVTVRDTGIGIPKDEIPYVFDRFHRSKDPVARERKGSGLGLAIVKGIVKAHGGRISVESRIGAGTTFRFTLPLAG